MQLFILDIKKAITKLMRRKDSGSYALLNENQKKLYELVREMSGGSKRRILKRKNVKQEFRYWYPGERDFEANSDTLSSFCYNRVHKHDRPNKFLLATGKDGRFRFVDFAWDSGNKEIEIYWKNADLGETFKVGYYKNKEFFWNFDIVLQYLREYE